MRKLPLIFIFLIALSTISVAQQLVEDQLNYPRVREAKEDYHDILKKAFAEKNVTFPPEEIFISSYKFDMEMELWAKGKEGEDFKLIKTYDICQVSGGLGPKREQGDLQIPEGVYQLEYFNPSSAFHLSMKINYPNEADKMLGTSGNLGGDIFIHGDCVTIGCIPIQDEPIKELYWLSVLTKSNGGQIPIHIFPFRMDSANLTFFQKVPYITDSEWTLWKQLEPIYSYFQTYKQLPDVKVNSKGAYFIESSSQASNG